jgi:very-short-patch-repair endonuclease
MNNKKEQLHNQPSLKPLRRALRSRMTSAEIALWMQLKSSQLASRKFRRQHSIREYVVDFYCPSERLIVELDGAPHDSEQGFLKDEERDAWLASLGFIILRIENQDVMNNMEGVLQLIQQQFR